MTTLACTTGNFNNHGSRLFLDAPRAADARRHRSTPGASYVSSSSLVTTTATATTTPRRRRRRRTREFLLLQARQQEGSSPRGVLAPRQAPGSRIACMMVLMSMRPCAGTVAMKVTGTRETGLASARLPHRLSMSWRRREGGLRGVQEAALEWLAVSTRSACQARASSRGGSSARGGRGGRGSGKGDGRGGRGHGRGGKGRRGGGGNDSDGPRFINSLLIDATSAREILSIVKVHRDELDYVNVSTAFSRLGRMARRRDFPPTDLTGDTTFRSLSLRAGEFALDQKFGAREVANMFHAIAKLCAARRLDMTEGMMEGVVAALEDEAVKVGPNMDPQAVANILWAYATLKRMPGAKTWEVLKAAAVQVGPDMDPQAVANILWAYATLKRMPGAKTWEVLEAAAVQVGPDMDPQAVANILWAYATLGKMPGANTWEVLEAAAVRLGLDMNPQAVANTLWAYATLGKMPGAKTWEVLEAAAVRLGPDMKPQDVANTLWACATLGKMPGAKTWEVLEAAAVRLGPDMDPQDVANTLWAYATLGKMPGAKTWEVLEAAAVRVGPSMNPQDVANTLWACAVLATLRDVELPSSYASLWDQVCNMEAHEFADEGLLMLFHVHLMRKDFLSAQVTADASTPGWMTVEARDAWMRNVRDDHTISRSHRELAQTLDALGIENEVEHVTDDGYFSIDIYLPDHDVAVEFDGPQHYYHSYQGDTDTSSSRGGRSGGEEEDEKAPYSSTPRRTAKTELRDLFLAKRCAKVLTVPWFECQRVDDSPETRASYVREMLREERVIL